VIRTSRRTAGRRLLVLAIAALIPALAGCDASANAPTQDFHQPTDGTGILFNKIAIRNVFVLGAPIGSTIRVGSSAGVFLALINGGSRDKLVSISAPGTARSVTLPGGSVSLASQQAVLLTGPAPKVVLEDLTRPLTGGSSVRLVLTFQNAASVGITVPVMPQAQYYSTFSPPPPPSPSPSPTTKSKHKTATPTPSASPSPAAST
jgi:copper(I)-binding protein